MPVYLNPYYRKIDTIEVVKKAADLAGVLDSSKVYIIDGSIDMGTIQIVQPQGGLTLRGNGFNVSKLYSSADNYTMIVDDGVYAGDLIASGFTIEVSGTNSKVFDVDNDRNNQAMEFDTVNFENCTNLGDIRNFRQLLFNGCGWLNGEQGFTLYGSMDGIALLDSIMLLFNNPTGYNLFAVGAGFSMSGSFRSNLNALNVPSDWVLSDFSESNISSAAGIQLSGLRTAADDITPNLLSSSVKAFNKNCRGIDNTFVGGDLTVTTSAVTTIGAVDKLYKMAGATTYSGLAWFSGAADNEFTYLSSEKGGVRVTGVLSFSGASNREMAVQIRQWENRGSTYINIGPEFKATMNGGSAGTRAENLSFQGIASVEIDDRIEIWVKNITDATNITTSTGGSVTISERAP